MTERNLHQDMTEAERRISNVAFMGQVVALNTETARVRVQAGSITSGWLPFTATRAGHDRSWHPPEPGEQVLVVAPGGDLNQGVVVGAIYRADHPAPADSADRSHTVFKDGAVIEYNREQHHLKAILPKGATVELMADGGIALTGDLTVKGHIKATGDITDHTRSMQGDRGIYNAHTHSDPQGGKVAPTGQSQ